MLFTRLSDGYSFRCFGQDPRSVSQPRSTVEFVNRTGRRHVIMIGLSAGLSEDTAEGSVAVDACELLRATVERRASLITNGEGTRVKT